MGQCELSELWNAALNSAMVTKIGYGLIGLASIYMGYRLFVLGVFRGGAEISAGSNEENRGFSFSISKGGPGLVFALFGACVVVYSIATRVDTSIQGGGAPQHVAAEEARDHQLRNAVMNLQRALEKEESYLQKKNEEMKDSFEVHLTMQRAIGTEEQEKKFNERMEEQSEEELQWIEEFNKSTEVLNTYKSNLAEIIRLLPSEQQHKK